MAQIFIELKQIIHVNMAEVLFKDHFTKPSFSRPTNQLWMMYFLECPLHTQNIRQKNMFNWTSTYRSDSTLGKC